MEIVNEVSDRDLDQVYEPRFAGFLGRLVATIIDGIIFYIIAYIILQLVLGMGWYQTWVLVPAGVTVPVHTVIFNYTQNDIVRIILDIINVMVWGLYYVLFTGSRFMATPGKMFLGLKVTDLEFNRISLGRSTLRFMARDGWIMVLNIILALVYPSGFLFMLLPAIRVLGFLLILITKKRQALHDIIAGTIVVKLQLKSWIPA